MVDPFLHPPTLLYNTGVLQLLKVMKQKIKYLPRYKAAENLNICKVYVHLNYAGIVLANVRDTCYTRSLLGPSHG